MWIDDLIGVISPMAALKRKQARLAADILQRTYDGAKIGRRSEGWHTAGSSANAEIYAAGPRLRDRARDLARNNAYGNKARRIFVDNFIGEGIKPQANTGSDALNEQIMEAWQDWVPRCNFEEDYDFYGLQALIVRGVFESGECFVRYRDMPFDGNTVPFQIQVLEADYLDLTRNYEAPTPGNYIRQGIEFDKQGKRVAYWMWPQHPGENMLIMPRLQSVRIPASQILHVFEKDRPGQIRGVPFFAPVIMRMKDLDDYDDAELLRKKIESCFAAFVIQNSGSEGPTLGNIVQTNAQGGGAGGKAPERIENFRPGMVEYLKPGEDVRFGNPNSDANYPNYARVQLHAIAAGIGITYEQMTGDLSQVNYSSLRAGLVEFRRMIETLRWQMFIPLLCMPVWKCFIDRAYIAGVISKADYGVTWTPPKFEQIDPLKDAQADTLMMRNGTMTLRQAIANQGFDPDEQIEEIARTNVLLDKDGIILDSDPRYTAQNGLFQPLNPEGDLPDAPQSTQPKAKQPVTKPKPAN